MQTDIVYMLFHVDQRTLFQHYDGFFEDDDGDDGQDPDPAATAGPAGSAVGAEAPAPGPPGPAMPAPAVQSLTADQCFQMLWCRYATQFLSTHMLSDETNTFSVRPSLQDQSRATLLTDLNSLVRPSPSPSCAAGEVEADDAGEFNFQVEACMPEPAKDICIEQAEKVGLLFKVVDMKPGAAKLPTHAQNVISSSAISIMELDIINVLEDDGSKRVVVPLESMAGSAKPVKKFDLSMLSMADLKTLTAWQRAPQLIYRVNTPAPTELSKHVEGALGMLVGAGARPDGPCLLLTSSMSTQHIQAFQFLEAEGGRKGQ